MSLRQMWVKLVFLHIKSSSICSCLLLVVQICFVNRLFSYSFYIGRSTNMTQTICTLKVPLSIWPMIAKAWNCQYYSLINFNFDVSIYILNHFYIDIGSELLDEICVLCYGSVFGDVPGRVTPGLLGGARSRPWCGSLAAPASVSWRGQARLRSEAGLVSLWLWVSSCRGQGCAAAWASIAGAQ